MQKENSNIIFFVLVSSVLVSLMYSIPGWLILEYFFPDSRDELLPYVIGLSQLLFLLTPALILGSKLPYPLKDTFRLRGKPGIHLYIAGIGGLASMRIFAIGYMILQEKLIPDFMMEYYKDFEKIVEEAYSNLLNADTPEQLVISLLIGALFPAVCEEFMFRGYLQSTLEKKLYPFLAIGISSVIFASIHFNPVEFIPLMMISILLGTSAYAGKSLKVPIFLHLINNAMVVVAMYFAVEEEQALPDIDILPAIGFLLGGLILFSACIIYIYKQRS